MDQSPEHPVFFDPDQKRWPRVRRGLFVAALVFTLVFGGLVASILINPVLPALRLPQSSLLPHGGHLAPPVPVATPTAVAGRRFLETKRRLESQRRARPAVLRPRRTSEPGHQMTLGFFVNWDDSSMTSLRENLSSLDVLVPEWLHLTGADGTVALDDPDRQASVVKFARERRPDLEVTPLINNFDGRNWQGRLLGRMLADSAARTHLVRQLLEYVTARRFDGVSIDFEEVPAERNADLTRLVEELSSAFHAAHLTVSVNVPADDDGFDYAGIARQADYVIVMAYDEHWPAGKPGPIAGLD